MVVVLFFSILCVLSFVYFLPCCSSFMLCRNCDRGLLLGPKSAVSWICLVFAEPYCSRQAYCTQPPNMSLWEVEGGGGTQQLCNWAVCLFAVACLTSQQRASVSQERSCTDVQPHWDRSCRSNVPSHPVTVYWHRATLPGAWRYRVSTGTGRPDVSILWLGEVERLICNLYLSVAVRKIVWADPSLRYTSLLLGR